MIVHTMHTRAIYQEALADWYDLDVKCNYLLAKARRATLRTRKPALRFERWRSPRHNHWFLGVVATKKAMRRYGMVHWNDRAGKLWAAVISQRFMLVLPPHFTLRLGERCATDARPLERLWQLWCEFPDMYASPIGYSYQGKDVYGMATPYGLGLGMEESPPIVVVRTFVNNERLGLLQRTWNDAQVECIRALRSTPSSRILAEVHRLQAEIRELDQQLTWNDLAGLLGEHTDPFKPI